MNIDYIIEFEIAAIMIQILLIVMYHVRHNEICENDKMFANLLYLALICTVSDIITIYTISHIDSVPLWFNYQINTVYLLAYNISSVAVLYYMIKIIGGKKLIKLAEKTAYVVMGIMAGLIIPTWRTGLVFSLENGVYQHGVGIIILYGLSVSLLTMILIILIMHRKTIDHLQFGVMIAMNVITISSIIIQAFFKHLLLQNFAITLSYCMLYMSLQNPNDYMDKFTGCRNRKSFYRVMEERISDRQRVSLVGFVIEEFIQTQVVMGFEETGKLLNKISMYLMKYFGKDKVFHVDDAKYIVLYDEKDETASNKIIDAIERYFEKPIHFEGWEWNFTPNFFEMKNQEVLLEEGKDIIERVFFQLENDRKQETVYIDNKFIEKIRDEKKLIHQMKNAVKEKRFEVYYQPILDIRENKFRSVEALVRFFDEDGKMVSPDYFIPIAEKNGMILEIGEIVLEKVCQFIKNQRAADQFEYVEINLSTVQCVQENLPDMIRYYTKKYDIDPSRLNFEITETAEMASEEMLLKNMRKLCKEGYSFSLDDFGTGFSTALYLTRMTVDMVKIDKSILWNAMENEGAMSILESMVLMIKKLKKKVLVEGIETEQMADILRKLGCDYLQGFLYSKPLPEEDLVAFLEKQVA